MSPWRPAFAKGAMLAFATYLIAAMLSYAIARISMPSRIDVELAPFLLSPEWMILALLAAISAGAVFQSRTWIIPTAFAFIASLLVEPLGATSGPSDVVSASMMLWNARLMLGIWFAVSPCLLAAVMVRRTTRSPMV